MKYNLALIPTSKQSSVVNCSNLLSTIADSYLLGAHSLPHLTLYQFHANKSDIKSIWENVCNNMNQRSVFLTFETFSCISFDQDTFWTSLLPDNVELLMKMHADIAGIIEQPVKNNYDPHMTLINTRNPSYEDLVHNLAKTYKPIRDTFVLALGVSDEIGQFVELLYSST
jgi:hypothetical protein